MAKFFQIMYIMDAGFGHLHGVIHAVQTHHEVKFIAYIIVIKAGAVSLVGGAVEGLPAAPCAVFTGNMSHGNGNGVEDIGILIRAQHLGPQAGQLLGETSQVLPAAVIVAQVGQMRKDPPVIGV